MSDLKNARLLTVAVNVYARMAGDNAAPAMVRESENLVRASIDAFKWENDWIVDGLFENIIGQGVTDVFSLRHCVADFLVDAMGEETLCEDDADALQLMVLNDALLAIGREG